ncbi:MAG TPA: hypothetical protein VGM10_30720 [Actinocrinis sp.]|jgi:hypothetical protein
MQKELARELGEPMGFRVWRAVTKSVLLNTPKGTNKPLPQTAVLRKFVETQLKDAERLRTRSLYPGRSLDMELAIIVPASWSTDEAGTNWVREVLLTRAMNQEATLRERGTAAFGLWQRAHSGEDPDKETVCRHVLDLVTSFRKANDRPDIASGLRWTAATLQHCVEQDTATCNTWPTTSEPWFDRVMQAAASLDQEPIPTSVRPGTRTLFEHALLQNAGVYRRQAIETLIAAGLASHVTPALIEYLEHEHESWLRIRALFALGFVQRRDRQVSQALYSACLRAYRQLNWTDPDSNPRAPITELHAALFAVGDCFGPRGAEAAAREVRAPLSGMLEQLVTEKQTDHSCMWPVARATAYLLTVTAQPRRAGQSKPDLAQRLLTELENHPDESVTGRLSTWAKFRFAENGSIVPLLDATRDDEARNSLATSGSWMGLPPERA